MFAQKILNLYLIKIFVIRYEKTNICVFLCGIAREHLKKVKEKNHSLKHCVRNF